VQSTQKINHLLLVKEYSDPFHNFNEGARFLVFSRTFDGFLMKHVVSYRDMINDIEQGRKLPKVKL
jgi:hypothetical protein